MYKIYVQETDDVMKLKHNIIMVCDWVCAPTNRHLWDHNSIPSEGQYIIYWLSNLFSIYRTTNGPLDLYQIIVQILLPQSLRIHCI